MRVQVANKNSPFWMTSSVICIAIAALFFKFYDTAGRNHLLIQAEGFFTRISVENTCEGVRTYKRVVKRGSDKDLADILSCSHRNDPLTPLLFNESMVCSDIVAYCL